MAFDLNEDEERWRSNWDHCDHDWKESPYSDIGGDRTIVECKKCGCPGERDDNTGEVFWPAT
jgi:hypothetical protein